MEGPPSRSRGRHHDHAQGRFEIAQGLFVDLQGYVRLDPSSHPPEDTPDVGAELGGANAQRETEVRTWRPSGNRGQAAIRDRCPRAVVVWSPPLYQPRQELHSGEPPA